MDGIQGAILGVKLKRLDGWIAARRARAALYRAGLADVAVDLPAPAAGEEHVWHVFAVRVADRDRVAEALAAAGIATGQHYPIPVHLQPAHADLGHRPGAFPVAEAIAASTLSLPLYPELAPAQVARVSRVLASIVGPRVTSHDAA
jgi:dTDP-4-amino-4,6-dideoxygalactose transaminase